MRLGDNVKDVRNAVVAAREYVLQQFDLSPSSIEEVNNGYCNVVAIQAAKSLPTGDVTVLELQRDEHSHVWLTADGKHFDAEAPSGVGDWRELPFFSRHQPAEGSDPIVYLPANDLI